jgi:ParB family chromosome partitioning protein
MATKKTQTLILKAAQIEKNPTLALSVSEKDIAAYRRLTRAFGNVTPVIVGPTLGQGYRILSGQTQCDAMSQLGNAQIPVVVANTHTESEQIKLALMLCTLREEISSLSEGTFINTLIRDHGMTQQDLARMLRKSKSWVSKRHSLAVKLVGEVKELVKSGTLCARSAEEIAKLPADTQIDFAKTIVRDSLNKTNVATLVRLYTHPCTSPATQETILQNPQAVVDAKINPIRQTKQPEKRTPAQKITGNMRFLVQLICELKGLLTTANITTLTEIACNLKMLQEVTADLRVILAGALIQVSPGKPMNPAGGETL